MAHDAWPPCADSQAERARCTCALRPAPSWGPGSRRRASWAARWALRCTDWAKPAEPTQAPSPPSCEVGFDCPHRCSSEAGMLRAPSHPPHALHHLSGHPHLLRVDLMAGQDGQRARRLGTGRAALPPSLPSTHGIPPVPQHSCPGPSWGAVPNRLEGSRRITAAGRESESAPPPVPACRHPRRHPPPLAPAPTFMPGGAPGTLAAMASSCSGGRVSIMRAMDLSMSGFCFMATAAACRHGRAGMGADRAQRAQRAAHLAPEAVLVLAVVVAGKGAPQAGCWPEAAAAAPGSRPAVSIKKRSTRRARPEQLLHLQAPPTLSKVSYKPRYPSFASPTPASVHSPSSARWDRRWLRLLPARG